MAALNGGKKKFLSLPSLNSTGPALVPLLAIPPATKCLAQANTVFSPVRLSVLLNRAQMWKPFLLETGKW